MQMVPNFRVILHYRRLLALIRFALSRKVFFFFERKIRTLVVFRTLFPRDFVDYTTVVFGNAMITQSEDY